MQPFVIKNSVSPGKNYGFDEPLADGIPSLSEYVAEYCDAAVSAISFLLNLCLILKFVFVCRICRVIWSSFCLRL